MKQTFLFYDIETSGLNKAFDQVLQFAAIRTDLEFNEVERHELKVRLSPDVIPSPGAVLTHHISLTEMQQGISELEATVKIHQILNQPGTISLGYNTLGFDDEFLRFSFYRHLLPPYTHQYANQCGRADLYPMIIIYFLYKNEVLQWPKLENRISLKLEQLNKVNQLSTGRAHDAMGDVETTLALAKKLQQENDTWQYLLGYFDKKTDLERYTKLNVVLQQEQQSFREGLLVDGSFGADRNYLAPVLCLGQHHHYKNQMCWLRLDDERLQQAKVDNIQEYCWVTQKKIGDSGFVLPINERYLTSLTPARQQVATANKELLIKNPLLLQAIEKYYRHYTYPKIPNLDVAAALYENGFLTAEDELQCRRFHQVSLSEKIQVIKQMRNEACRQQALRILGRHHPEILTSELMAEYMDYWTSINPSNPEQALVDYRNQRRLTPQAALAEIEVIKKERTLSEPQQLLLQGLVNYLTEKFN